MCYFDLEKSLSGLRVMLEIQISEFDQHTHRFLWRNLEENRKPDITAASFGDKPVGAIASLALRDR